jgi:hypothetical protein
MLIFMEFVNNIKNRRFNPFQSLYIIRGEREDRTVAHELMILYPNFG